VVQANGRDSRGMATDKRIPVPVAAENETRDCHTKFSNDEQPPQRQTTRLTRRRALEDFESETPPLRFAMRSALALFLVYSLVCVVTTLTARLLSTTHGTLLGHLQLSIECTQI
jgi:hypothetical protein